MPALGAPQQLGEPAVLTRSKGCSRALHGAVIGRQLAEESVKAVKIAAADADLTMLNALGG
jgi:hypothetical protein